jgi:hypothetical protein
MANEHPEDKGRIIRRLKGRISLSQVREVLMWRSVTLLMMPSRKRRGETQNKVLENPSMMSIA